MGRESNDPIMFQSSIALLQERFRQLQRVKEMREERELRKMLAEPNLQCNPTVHYNEPSKLFFHFLPPTSPPQMPLSLCPDSQTKHADVHCMETPILMSLWPNEKPSMLASISKFDGSDSDDVDTSLHL